MLEYRSFRNADPPQLVKLWDECGLGRGAVKGMSSDAFEYLVYGQPYFDPRGLIVAHVGKRVVGFAHAGFGANAAQRGLDRTSGVICAVLVHPEFRRQGIGRTLMAEAEKYLRSAGAVHITAGQAAPLDPFYLGLYGGSRLPGFLESDAAAAPFLGALGYRAGARKLVFQRDITLKQDPVDFRLAAVRRSVQFLVTDKPEAATWWWVARYGRFETYRFMLMPASNGSPVAQVTGFGLDLYVHTWQQRCVGLTDLWVAEAVRRKAYCKALLLEVFRRLRSEMVTCVEFQVADDNVVALKLLETLKFVQVDTGVVYHSG